MRVLVVGSGGREHALVWALRRSPSAPHVFAAPGNPGIAELAPCIALDVADPAAIAQVADDLAADVVVIGPEVPLVVGAADAVRSRGRLAFGPGAAGARLEGSKAWMKQVLTDAGVPTARHATFGPGDGERALAFLGTFPAPYVVKTDGLAAGKGVVVTESLSDARDAVRAYLSGEAFGDAGRTLVIEEGLCGPELSLLVVCNGDPEAARPLAPAQDFKRIGDGDTGPNTGGMGAYSPVPIVSDATVDDVMDRAVRPTLRWLAQEGIEYRGVLYAGMMLTADGPKVIEYNVRFGDPECQVVLPRLASDLASLVHSAASGADLDVVFSGDACVTVVLATEGYPGPPRTGDRITGIADAVSVNSVIVFHAGTARGPADELLTAGGRVLDVTAMGGDVTEARERAYSAVERISWRGMQFRRDIAAQVNASGDERELRL
ncbi:MAG TPA: phosphoribosylamine--glycine ligase [Acidimicrobiales bacterium]|jgi:phosphoribosylamine--glycine ligase|nr:phosphoribosylamine--glycine ligase [Acidimicrobiales bacterium]